MAIIKPATRVQWHPNVRKAANIGVYLFTEPSNSAVKKRMQHEDMLFAQVIEVQGNWIKVLTSFPRVGWTRSTFLINE